MAQEGVEYREQTADEHALRRHLLRCSPDFIPPLNSTVDVEVYATKLHARSVTFEAWSEGELVGLVCAYLNDLVSRVGFITNVSVAPEQLGRGIGGALLHRCAVRAAELGFRELRLEVDARNARAIALYERSGFGEYERSGRSVLMRRSLPPANDV